MRDAPKKEKAAHRKTIPIPSGNDDADISELDADDMDFFGNEASSLTFLSQLDQKAIARYVHGSHTSPVSAVSVLKCI